MTETDLPRRRCTAFDETGRKRCGTIGYCTHVRTLNVDWAWMPFWLLGLGSVIFHHQPDDVAVLQDRWVCHGCRLRMKLPAYDIDFVPDVVAITDHIEHPRVGVEPFVLP